MQEAGCDMEGRSMDVRSCKTYGPPKSSPPPYACSYQQLPAARSNPLISAINWQVMAVSGFPSPSLISANICQVLLDLRIYLFPQSLISYGSPRNRKTEIEDVDR